MCYKDRSKKIDYLPLIKGRFGNVRRASGYYLYTDKGKRLLDMYLCGGRAILGHKPKGILTQYKRELDKGLFGILPYKTTGKIKQALKLMFPEYESACYATREKAIRRLEKAKFCYNNGLAVDFKISTYRHFVEQKLADIFLFLPYPSLDVTIVLYKNDNKLSFEDEDVLLPQEEVAIARFIYELMAKGKREREGAILHSMKSKKALKREKNAKKELESILPQLETVFTIEGRYLLFKNTCKIPYKKVFLVALENSILLSPFLEESSIFPEIENYSQIKKFLTDIQCL